MAFGTKKSVAAAPSFSERMVSIKSMFKKVLQMQQRILLLN